MLNPLHKPSMVQLNQWATIIVLSGIFSACSEYEVKAQLDPSLMNDSAEPIVTEDAPDIRINPSDISMGTICEPGSAELRISSLGSVPLTIESLAIAGGGWALNNPPTLPQAIAPGEFMNLSLIEGVGTGSLYVESNDPDTPVWEVPLSATLDSPPELEITSHGDGEVIEPGSTTEFVANVFDSGDAVEDLVVQWTSDVDGILTTSIPTSDGTVRLDWDANVQSSGDHTLSASVIDSCDTEARDQVDICQNEGYIDEGLALSTWNFEGHATWDAANEWVELTDTRTNRAGTAFQTSTTVDSDNVVIEFSFFVSGGSGADGISLTALDSTRMTGFVGSSGGGIGYAGLPGWSIEVDTWYNSENNDPTSADHLSVHIDGNQGAYVAWAALPEVEDGNWHDMSVTVSGSHMTVEVDGAVYIDQSISGLGAFPAYIGFTGATGSATNWHLIDSLEVEAFVCEN